jgi:hypothetical protein
MKRLLIYDPSVTDALRAGHVPDVALRNLENAIMRGEGNTVSGTGGLKKIRCGSAGKGKSGSLRVIYADYPVAGRTYLLAAFGKSDKPNLTKGECNELRTVKRVLDKAIERWTSHEK